MALGSQIYQWDPEAILEPGSAPRMIGDWRLVADLEDMEINISRLAVSPDGSKIAIVGAPIH